MRERETVTAGTKLAILIDAEYHSRMLIRELTRLQEHVQPYGQRVNEMLAQLGEIELDLSAWRLMESADEAAQGAREGGRDGV